MLANVDHSREQCVYLLFDNSLNCGVHFAKYHNVFVVQSRSISHDFTGMYIWDAGSACEAQRSCWGDAVEAAEAAAVDDEVRLKF